MKILERRVYRGPSQYAHFPVMRLTVDLGELEHWPTGKISNFNSTLLEALPTLDQHTCSFGDAGGFLRPVAENGGNRIRRSLKHRRSKGKPLVRPELALCNLPTPA